MKDDFIIFTIIWIIGLLAYFGLVMPVRSYLCSKYDMTAVWYIQGCVNKEVK